MKSLKTELGIAILIFAAFLVVLVCIKLIASYNEATTYNRLTGAHATTWDALWVELRVQAEPMRKDN